MLASLTELAEHIQVTPTLREIRAFRAEGFFGSRHQAAMVARALQRWGFEYVQQSHRPGPWQRFCGFWENLYETALNQTFNPGSRSGKALGQVRRDRLWISRQGLIARYDGKIMDASNPPIPPESPFSAATQSHLAADIKALHGS